MDEKGFKTWVDVPVGTINGAEQRFWNEIGANAYRVAAKINKDPVFLRKIGNFIRREISEIVWDGPILDEDALGRINITFGLHRSLSGERWIELLEAKGKVISDSARTILESAVWFDQRMKKSEIYTITIIPPCSLEKDLVSVEYIKAMIVNDYGPFSSVEQERARGELSCILCAMIPREQWKKWRIDRLVVIHKEFPLAISNTHAFFGTDNYGDTLMTYEGRKGSLVSTNDFAIGVLTSSQVLRGLL